MKNQLSLFRYLFVLLTSSFLFFSTFAQDGSNDGTFNPSDAGYGRGDGPNGSVNIVVLQPDGKALVGGTFNSYNGALPARLVRIKSDGTLDSTFNLTGTGANNSVL